MARTGERSDQNHQPGERQRYRQPDAQHECGADRGTGEDSSDGTHATPEIAAGPATEPRIRR